MTKALSGSRAAIPRQYCIWCGEKPATPINFPHCSVTCKRLDAESKR